MISKSLSEIYSCKSSFAYFFFCFKELVKIALVNSLFKLYGPKLNDGCMIGIEGKLFLATLPL
jgi:hypothetical protein